MSIHEDWCDPGRLGTAPIVDIRDLSRGTCPKCGYVGPLRPRAGVLYPHKRFDRFAPEPAPVTGDACWRHDYGHREYICRCDPPRLGDTGREDDQPGDVARYECPRCLRVAPWTDGRTVKAGDEFDEFWCQTCGAETPLEDCRVVPR